MSKCEEKSQSLLYRASECQSAGVVWSPSYVSTACGIKIIACRNESSEPDLLVGRENASLVVKGPTDQVIYNASASIPWTHDSIVAVLGHDDVVHAVNGDVADAYLGDCWIGSTEL